MRFKLPHIAFLAVLICTLSGVTKAADGYYLELFEKANQAYKEGAYDSAKSIYNEIAQNGIVSSELFYNLGNAHFKDGNIPASILYYERALRLDPNDEDIAYNLNIAEGFITDKIDPIDDIFLVDWWNNIAFSFSPTGWGIAFLLLLTLAATLFCFFVLARQRKVRQLGLLGGIVAIIVAVIVLTFGNTAQNRLESKEAIVFSPSVNVKSEPGLNATDQFVIHEGLKVKVLGTDGEWTRIRLADGNSGWLPNQAIERI